MSKPNLEMPRSFSFFLVYVAIMSASTLLAAMFW